MRTCAETFDITCKYTGVESFVIITRTAQMFSYAALNPSVIRILDFQETDKWILPFGFMALRLSEHFFGKLHASSWSKVCVFAKEGGEEKGGGKKRAWVENATKLKKQTSGTVIMLCLIKCVYKWFLVFLKRHCSRQTKMQRRRRVKFMKIIGMSIHKHTHTRTISMLSIWYDAYAEHMQHGADTCSSFKYKIGKLQWNEKRIFEMESRS